MGGAVLPQLCSLMGRSNQGPHSAPCNWTHADSGYRTEHEFRHGPRMLSQIQLM